MSRAKANLNHLLRTFQYLDDTDPSKARIQETMERGRALADALLDAAKNQHRDIRREREAIAAEIGRAS